MMTEQQRKLIEQFEKFYTVFDDVSLYLDLDKTTQTYYLQRKSWIERLVQIEFPVAFLGTFSAGKSTSINAILGLDLLPESTKATTAFPTIIKKGTPEKNMVYYLDDAAKFELQGLLIQEISKELKEEIAIQDRRTFLAELNRKITEFEQKSRTKINREAYEKLEVLFQGWEKLNILERQIQRSEIKDYIEGHKDALFIDRIEIALPDIALPEDIILVDLPGLGVTNQRHVKITEDYVQVNAKAFVVCTAPIKLLEGQEIELLNKLNRQNPTILQRSFWLINQMDAPNPEQKQQSIRDFQEKASQHHFVIDPAKVFKVSALNYALLTHLCNGTLDQTSNLKKHLDNLDKIVPSGRDAKSNPEKARELLDHNEEVKAFNEFQQALFAYLNMTAKQEFLASARGELYRIVSDLIDVLTPFDRQYQPGVDYEKILFSATVDKALNPFIAQLQQTIEEAIKQIRLSNKRDQWGQAYQNEMISHIQKILTSDAEEIRNLLTQGIDVDENLSRLPAIIDERLTKNDHVRETMIEAVRKPFIEEFLNTLYGKLIDVNRSYLPESVRAILKDHLSERDITMRLYGLADSMLYQYMQKIDDIGLNLGQTVGKTPGEDRITKAIEAYRKEMVIFMTTLSNQLNQNVWRTIKNHAEYVRRQLFEVLRHEREAIHEHIAKGVNLSEEVGKEQQKRLVIQRGYADLIKLRQEL